MINYYDNLQRRLFTSTALLPILLLTQSVNAASDSPKRPEFNPSNGFVHNQSLPSPLRNDIEYGEGLIIGYKKSMTSSKLQSKASLQSMNMLSSRLGLQATHKRFTALGSQVINFNTKQSITSLEQLAKTLRKDPNIAYVNINRMMHPTLTPNDSRLNEMWGLIDPVSGIRAQTAWDDNQGEGTTVAVLDTGFRPHADLVANIVGGFDFVSNATNARDGDGRDFNAQDEGDWCGTRPSSWHGTHVAGTIAAVGNNGIGTVGVAYKSRVVPIRVLARCGGTTADIADAMLWASGGNVPGVPNNPNPARVINLSLGGSGACQNITQNSINLARANGAIFVISAGNDNRNVNNATPANCDGVIAVASLNRTANRSAFSNFGNRIDIAAPGGGSGGGVLSTLNTGITTPELDNYAFYQGTSMAAPHVAGVIALMLAKNPTLTSDQIETLIENSARPFPAGSSCNVNDCGAGMLDAAAAVAAAGGTDTPPPPPNPDPIVPKPSGVNIYSEYMGCRNYQPRYLLSFSAQSSAPILEYDLDFKTSYSTNWNSLYNGTSGYRRFNGGSSTQYFVRVRARNSGGWSSFVSTSLRRVNCSSPFPLD